MCINLLLRSPPKISITDTTGLSDQQVEELTQILLQQSLKMKGEEMIYELSQTVQEFLHKHNKEPSGSLYDLMIQEQTKRVAKSQQTQQRQTLSAEMQQVREEVLRRKEIIQNEHPNRREVRRSISEASPNHRSNSSSDNSDLSASGFRWPMATTAEHCAEHRNSEVLYFPNVGRKLQRGWCLGESREIFQFVFQLANVFVYLIYNSIS